MIRERESERKKTSVCWSEGRRFFSSECRQFAELCGSQQRVWVECVGSHKTRSGSSLCALTAELDADGVAVSVHAIATFDLCGSKVRVCPASVLVARCWYGCQCTATALHGEARALTMRASRQRICSVRTGRGISTGAPLLLML